MARHDVAGVLYAKLAFPQGLVKIPENTGNVHEAGHHQHMDHREGNHACFQENIGRQKNGEPAAEKARPGFLGRYFRAHLGRPQFLTEQHAKAVGAHIRRPDDNEERQHEKAAIAASRAYHKRRKGHRKADIQQPGQYVCVFLEILMVDHHVHKEADKQQEGNPQVFNGKGRVHGSGSYEHQAKGENGHRNGGIPYGHVFVSQGNLVVFLHHLGLNKQEQG